MKKLNPIYRGIMCCALAIPATALAQGGQILEEIVITGSLIRGIPEDAAMPVDTISQDDLDKQGAPPPLEMLKSLSYMNGIVGESNNFSSGRGQAAHGTASINMRGLGAARTLVLLNGKRIASSDANRLPTNAIARVEVLKDGGAVTYGSDAIGGVVNYITKETQDGFEFSADYRGIEESDGDYNIGLSWGTSTANSDFFASLNYYHRSQLGVSDRNWAVRPYSKNPEGGWSTGANPGAFRFGTTTYVDPGCTGSIANGVITAATNIEDPNGSQCRTQYTPWYNLVDEQDSYQFFSSYSVNLNDNTDLKIEALYAQTEVPYASSAPSYTTANYAPGQLLGGSAGTYNPFFYASGANPYVQDMANRVGETPGTAAVFVLNQWRPFFTAGNPAYNGGGLWTNYDRDQYRLSAELTGLLGDDIGYRTSLSYSKADDTRQERDIRIDKLQRALNGQGGPDHNLWFNPFSTAYTEGLGADDNAIIANWLMETHSSTSEDELVEFNFVLDGELSGIELAGGTVGWAAGVQYRHETRAQDYSDNANKDLNPCALWGDTSCVGSVGDEGRSPWLFLGTYVPYDLSREVTAVFGEMMIPVTDNFTAQVAARFEDYGNNGGDSFDPNIRLRWQATDWMAFRASAGTTFRVAPQTSLREVESTGFTNVLGVNKPVGSTGNSDLKPEESTNYNLGVMFTGDNFSFTLDYWRFDIDKRLTTTPLSGVLAKVFPNGSTGANNCATVDQAFLDQHFEFGGQPCSANNINKVKLNAINGSGMITDGIDVAGSYNWDEVGPGYLTLGGSATYINKFETETLIVEGELYERGFDGVGKFNSGTSLMPLPEWRGNLYLDYGMDTQNIRWTINYIDGYKDERSPDIFTHYTSGQTVSSFTTHNLTYRVDFNDNVTLSAVVDNVFDRDPPFVRAEMNYDPVTANPLGRTFKFGAKVRF